MKEKIDRLKAASRYVDTNTVLNEMVRELIHSHFKKMSKLFTRYKNMKKEGLDHRASDPTYRLLDADSIQQQNALLRVRVGIS